MSSGNHKGNPAGGVRGGILSGLILGNSRVITDVHRLVNEHRAAIGMPPIDWADPPKKEYTQQQQQQRQRNGARGYRERMAAARDIPGLVGEIVRTRQRRDLSLKAAAAEIGISQWTLCLIEKGHKTPGQNTLQKIRVWLHRESK